MEYGDKEGATSCKNCPLGQIPSWKSSHEIGCDPCRKGTFGKSDGKCHYCRGPMEYGDKEGATSCKNCPLGQIPSWKSSHEIGCDPCRKGTFGKSDGKCHYCRGPMEYGDKEGATSCKNCPLGQIPLRKLSHKIGCAPCSKGTFGKSDGKCYSIK